MNITGYIHNIDSLKMIIIIKLNELNKCWYYIIFHTHTSAHEFKR